MQLDAYQRCVGGADKKIKFCCGKEILGDLNSIFEALEGDQRAAALDRANRAIAKLGEKDCLLATKVSVLIQLNEFDQAAPLVEKLLERNPHNPVALGQKTTLLAIADLPEAAVDCLQEALEHYDRTISRGVLNAIRIVGALLQAHGNLIAARAHLVLYNSLATEPDPEVSRLMLGNFSDPSVPIFVKHDFDLPIAPAEGSWSATYNALRANSIRGRWKSSLIRMRELDEQYPGQPILRKAIAVLEGRVGTPPTQAEAWRRYAETVGVPFEEAIEAEAIAQTLKNDTLDDGRYERKLLVFSVADVEAAIAALNKHPRAAEHSDLRMPHPDMPPPKAAYSILDGPPLADDEELALDTVPVVLGSVMVYGRETDHEPRIEIEGFEGFGLEESIETAREAVGSVMGAESESSTKIGESSALDLRMGVRWYIARPLAPETRRNLLREHFIKFQNETWPTMALSRFQGKTAREAAADPANHRALLAWLMGVEELIDSSSFDWIDLNPLRASLGLPLRNMVAANGLNLDRLPLFRFSKLDFDSLSDEQVARAIHIGRIAGHSFLLRRAIEQRLKRGGDSIPAREEYDLRMQHAMLTPNTAEGRTDFEQMERIRDKAEIPRGRHLAMLLDWALGRGEVDLLEPTMETLQKRHFQEPGLAEEIARILVRHGVISPDGQPRGGARRGAARPTPQAPPIPDKTIWTSEASDAPPASGSGSKLWLPGMD